MNIPQSKRKRKIPKWQTYSARQQADCQCREAQRPENHRRHGTDNTAFASRGGALLYTMLPVPLCGKQRAIDPSTISTQQTLASTLSANAIRVWYHPVLRRDFRRNGYCVLMPRSTCPHTIYYQVPQAVVGVIFTLRRGYWSGVDPALPQLERWEISAIVRGHRQAPYPFVLKNTMICSTLRL